MGKYDIIVDEMEAKLRPPTIGLKPYEPKVIPLTTGEDMLVREAKPEEIEMIVEASARCSIIPRISMTSFLPVLLRKALACCGIVYRTSTSS